MVAAELVALHRGDYFTCGCCTPHPDRRAALDRLHEQDQRTRIATALHHLAPLTVHYRRRGRVA